MLLIRNGVRAALDAGLSTVVDLRNPAEIKQAHDRFPGATGPGEIVTRNTPTEDPGDPHFPPAVLCAQHRHVPAPDRRRLPGERGAWVQHPGETWTAQQLDVRVRERRAALLGWLADLDPVAYLRYAGLDEARVRSLRFRLRREPWSRAHGSAVQAAPRS